MSLLKGKKTYILSWLAVAWEIFYILNNSNQWIAIDETAHRAVMVVLIGGAASSMRAGIAKAEDNGKEKS